MESEKKWLWVCEVGVDGDDGGRQFLVAVVGGLLDVGDCHF